MVLGHIGKPVAIVAEALVTPGTLNTLLIFTIVAAAEILLNNTIFVCPCRRDLATLYGLSFLIVPAIILFLADFPWKLFSSCPSPGVLCAVSRRPIGLAVTWVIIGSLQRKYIDCIVEVTEVECGQALTSVNVGTNVCCEGSSRSTIFQLVGLYIWLLIIVVAFALLLCRRRRQSCISGRSSSLELTTRFQIEEKAEREKLIKRLKYGTTRLVTEADLTLDSLQSIQPGLNPKTFSALQSEELLQPSVLAHLQQDDLLSLDVSIAQRCLLRALIHTVRENPEILKQFASCQTKLNNRTCAAVNMV